METSKYLTIFYASTLTVVTVSFVVVVANDGDSLQVMGGSGNTLRS